MSEKEVILGELFLDLKNLTNETSGFVFTFTFGKKSQMWSFYVFSTKCKIENINLSEALSDTIKYVKENRVETETGFKMK